MNRPEADQETCVTSGQLLMLNDQHRIAIHSHAGELWVAEFRDEHVDLVHAAAWFRLNCGICHTSFTSPSLRRALRFAEPLSDEMVKAIEKLHQRRIERAAWSDAFLRRIFAIGDAAPAAWNALARIVQHRPWDRERLVAPQEQVR